MNYLASLLGNLTRDAHTMRLALSLLVGGAVFLTAAAVMFLALGAMDPVRWRLKQVGAREQRDRARPAWMRAAETLGPIVLPKDDWKRQRITVQLVHAGYRGPSAATIYYGLRALLAVLLPSVVVAVASWWPNASPTGVAYAAATALVIGFMLPKYVLVRKVAQRQRLIREAFPDALDLIVVCVEAGLGLHAAIERVGAELSLTHPVLASELAIVNAEIRAGIDRAQALKNLAERTGLDDIRGLVALLVQSIRFGSSIAETLRVYAEEFRDKRMQAAEEVAAKIGTKIIFPLVFCLFPSFFLVAIGPGILGIIKSLSDTMPGF